MAAAAANAAEGDTPPPSQSRSREKAEGPVYVWPNLASAYDGHWKKFRRPAEGSMTFAREPTFTKASGGDDQITGRGVMTQKAKIKGGSS